MESFDQAACGRQAGAQPCLAQLHSCALSATPGPSRALSSVSLSLFRGPPRPCGRLLCCGAPRLLAVLGWPGFEPRPFFTAEGMQITFRFERRQGQHLLFGTVSLCCLRGAGPLAARLPPGPQVQTRGEGTGSLGLPFSCFRGPRLGGTPVLGSPSVSGRRQSAATWALCSRSQQVNTD